MEKKKVTKFSTGAIRDSQEGKEDYLETLSWTGLRIYIQYMTEKKKKYGSGNFKKGIPDESYEKSLVRHLQKFLENKYEGGMVELDGQFGNYDHICGIIFNAFGLLHNYGMKKK